jgi:uncharacterized protein YbcV (DUF1398 family)
MDEAAIQQVYQEAAEKKWVYPQLFEALKKIGVDRYEVEVLKHEIKYVVGQTAVIHAAPAGFKPLTLGRFDAAAFKTALARSQKHETNYDQFLAEIASAGIVFYRVDMKPRTVTYHGEDRRNKIVEPVPPLQGQ